MTTLREAAQAALNAWEYDSNECRWHMDNLRAALAAEPTTTAPRDPFLSGISYPPDTCAP